MKKSLRNKITFGLFAFAVVLIVIAVTVSYIVNRDMMDKHYKTKADELSAVIAQAVDISQVRETKGMIREVFDRTENKVFSDEWGSPAFNAYVENFAFIGETPVYKALLGKLREIQNSIDVECVYLSMTDPVEKAFVYLVDADTEEPCPIGCMDPIYEINYSVLEDPARGFPAYITNTEEYGWLVSAGSPVTDEDGTVLCYAFVDVSMEHIRAWQHQFLITIVVIMSILTLLSCVFVLLYVNRAIVRPINQLAGAASLYGQNKDESGFKKLDIHTGDELESLLNSMVQMENDIDSYISNLMETREQLSTTRQQADHMNRLAHKDALTGVRNKLAYNTELRELKKELENGRKAFGFAMADLNFLKKINDEYGHENGDAAILRLSRILCSVFVHSPVFRVGGDEFVVVLRNHDYEKIQELTADFNRQIEELQNKPSLPPWEKISAALGYALYDPALDSGVEDVFHRADQKMYERKKDMHSIRE